MNRSVAKKRARSVNRAGELVISSVWNEHLSSDAETDATKFSTANDDLAVGDRPSNPNMMKSGVPSDSEFVHRDSL